MKIQAIATLIYGFIILAGGVMGFVMAKSTPSLISGGLLGIVAIVGAVLLFNDRPAGKTLALIAAILVAGFFGFQLFKGLSAGTPIGRAAGILAISVIEIAVLLFLKNSKLR